MRASSILFIIMAAVASQIDAQAQTSATVAGPESLRIQYTGRLFGYYRIEWDQTADQYLAPVKKFLEMRDGEGEEEVRPLLLGMGDNFAPEMGAALQLKHSVSGCEPSTGSNFPEDLYKSSIRNALARMRQRS